METKIQVSGNGIGKVVGATCVATGVVALSAFVASGAAVGAVVNSFKTAKNIVKEILNKENTSDMSATESGNIEMAVTDGVKKDTADCTVQEEDKAENRVKSVGP